MLLGCLNQVSVQGQTIQPIESSVGKLQISIDPRMEILTTIQLLSDIPENNRDLPYSKDILNYFGAFSSHEAVTIRNALANEYGFMRDAPVTFMLHISQPPELEKKIEFTDNLKGRSGGNDNLEKFRKAIKHLAET